jgi:hypothetical protein
MWAAMTTWRAKKASNIESGNSFTRNAPTPLGVRTPDHTSEERKNRTPDKNTAWNAMNL